MSRYDDISENEENVFITIAHLYQIQLGQI